MGLAIAFEACVFQPFCMWCEADRDGAAWADRDVFRYPEADREGAVGAVGDSGIGGANERKMTAVEGEGWRY